MGYLAGRQARQAADSQSGTMRASSPKIFGSTFPLPVPAHAGLGGEEGLGKISAANVPSPSRLPGAALSPKQARRGGER